MKYSLGQLINVRFGFYHTGYSDLANDGEEVDVKASMENIKDHVEKNHMVEITDRLSQIGLFAGGLSWYSPKQYNFEDDSLDINVTVLDKDKLKRAILEKENEIDEALGQNKSYDGYIALTVSSAREEIEKMSEKNYSIDPIVLRVLLDLDLDDDIDLMDLLEWESSENVWEQHGFNSIDDYNSWRGA